MSVFLCPTFGAGYQSFLTTGLPNNTGLIYTYAAGSTTAQATYTTSAGITPNANPIVLSADGRLANEVWLTGGISYKFVVTDSLGNVLGTYDNISGINDTTAAGFSEWVNLNLTPTYISATSFSVTGNQTGVLTVSRRLKTTNTGGIIYSTISTSTYNSGTGVTTVVVTNDSGTLDSGLSSVEYGFADPTHPSIDLSVNATTATNLTGIGNAAAFDARYILQSNEVTAASDPTFADDSTKVASTNWIRGAMSAIATAAGFAASFATNGYVKSPSWLGSFIIQWGRYTASGSGYAAFTFPIAFPTEAYSVTGTVINDSVNSLVAPTLNTITTSGFNAACLNQSQAYTNSQFSIIAIGK